MKQTFVLLLVAIVSLSLIMGGCGKNDTAEEKPSEQDKAKQAEKPAVESAAKSAAKSAVKSVVEPAPKPAVEPTPKPVVKPAPKPAVEPTSKPAIKLAPKPAVKLTPKPVVKPAVKLAPKPAAGKAVKGPWADAKVGTMTKLKGMGGVSTVLEVVKADPKNVTIRMTMLGADGKPLAGVAAQERVQPREFAADSKEAKDKAAMDSKKVGNKTITVAGQSLACVIYETVTEHADKKITTRMYYCQDVPGGMVLMESDVMGKMQKMSELVEFKK